jgi:outer membrane protein TolC
MTALLIAASPASPEVVEWPALVAQIERTNPLMTQAHAGLDRLEAVLKSAKWRHFPVLEIEAGLGPQPSVRSEAGNTVLDAERWGYYYRVGVRLEQPLYSFGKLAGLKLAASHGVEVGHAQVEVARWELRCRAHRAYQGAVLAREIASLLDEGQRWIETVRVRIEVLRTEDSDRYDQMAHLRLKSRFGQIAQMKADNQALYEEMHQALRLLLSWPAERTVRPGPERVVVTPLTLRSVGHYLAIAERQRPALRQARAGATVKSAQADSAEAAVWPDLVLLGELTAVDSDVLEVPGAVPGDRPLGVAAGLLLGLRWRLDVPSAVLHGRAVRAHANQLIERVRQARSVMESEVRRLHGRLSQQGAVLEATEASKIAARSWLSAAWSLYDAGFGDLRDVTDALDQFWSTHVGHLRAVVTHNVWVVELSRAVGQDITTAQEIAP